MTRSFCSILVPVDFSANTSVAITKAVWLAGHSASKIHLLHIITTTSQAGGLIMQGITITTTARPRYIEEKVRLRLNEIKKSIEKQMPGSEIITEVAYGDMIQKHIIEYANIIQPDLIIIAKNKNHDWLTFLKMVNASSIAHHTNCPVLTVKPGSLPNKLKSIVIPVGSFVPLRKIELLTALAKNCRPFVHLITIDGENEFGHNPGIFLETYRMVAEKLHYPVTYVVVKGKNAATAILHYSKSVMADIIMINPNEESKINPFFGVQINDLIQPTSSMSVLTAKPYLESNINKLAETFRQARGLTVENLYRTEDK
ncbi:MAG TPA: universal stress protein [Chitinophagaceae bacterium]|nr:universal stress protein [Chitinophagaceae bacterium]